MQFLKFTIETKKLIEIITVYSMKAEGPKFPSSSDTCLPFHTFFLITEEQIWKLPSLRLKRRKKNWKQRKNSQFKDYNRKWMKN